MGEILDRFRAQLCVAIEKEVVATTSLTHGFINSLQPCLLVSSKPLLVILRLTPFGASIMVLLPTFHENVQNFENNFRVLIHSPR
uniref:Uncharacterized protein n=1 Tax=Solanum lycopersicum TaxID=4081 RepID=A0A3Q7FIG7_SOLLC